MDDIRHDPQTIRDHAHRVERSANRVLVGMTMLGFLIGAGFGLIFLPLGSNGVTLAIVTAGFGLTGGFMVGDAQAEALRLAARMALRQVAE